MPAFAILDIDPSKEPARLSNLLGPNYDTLIKFGDASGHLIIRGATGEELEIIAAMINAIGERTKSEGKHHVEYHGA